MSKAMLVGNIIHFPQNGLIDPDELSLAPISTTLSRYMKLEDMKTMSDIAEITYSPWRSLPNVRVKGSELYCDPVTWTKVSWTVSGLCYFLEKEDLVHSPILAVQIFPREYSTVNGNLTVDWNNRPFMSTNGIVYNAFHGQPPVERDPRLLEALETYWYLKK